MALSLNLAGLWEAFADAQPDHIAMVVGEACTTWRALDDRAARLSGALAGLGAGPGTKVAQLLYNCPEYLTASYAAMKLRAVPVNVNYRYRAAEISHVLNDSGAEVLVFHGSLAVEVEACRALAPGLRALVQVDDGSPLLDGALRFDELTAGPPAPRRTDRSGDDVLLLYTGGTTGLPKGVVWRHADVLGSLAFVVYQSRGLPVPESDADAGRMAAELNARGLSPVMLCAPPLMHGTALFQAVSAFVVGGSVVLLGSRRFDADELLRLVERERVTQIALVGDPFAIPIVAALERAAAAGRPYDLSSLERIVSSGAMFSAETKRSLLRFAAPTIMDVLGASEGGPFGLSITLPGQDPAATAVFVADEQTVVLDADGTVIPRGSGRPGVLAYGGPIPAGYHNDPVRTAATFRQIGDVRYSVPGDHATIDADGTIHLLGRGSVSINTGGEKVFPEEVEVAARRHPAVADCVAVAVPDARFGATVGLVVALRPGHEASPDEIAAAVGERLADFKRPRHVVFVDEVRRSPAGKPDYQWARRQAEVAGRLASKSVSG